MLLLPGSCLSYKGSNSSYRTSGGVKGSFRYGEGSNSIGAPVLVYVINYVYAIRVS